MRLTRWLIGTALIAGFAAPAMAQYTSVRPQDESFNQTTQSCTDIRNRQRRAECISQRAFDGQGSTPSHPAAPFGSDRDRREYRYYEGRTYYR